MFSPLFRGFSNRITHFQRILNKKDENNSQQADVYRKLMFLLTIGQKKISPLSFAAAAIFDGFLRTDVNARHAVYAVPFPLGDRAAAESYINNGTNLFTQAAAVAFFCGMKFFVLNKNTIEKRVDS